MRYFYEEISEPRSLTSGDDFVLEEELGKIPCDLVGQIRASAGCADYYELMKRIDEVALFSPKLAGFLQDLARRFNYEKCIASLNGKPVE